MVADKWYHSTKTVLELKEMRIRGNLSETDRGRRNWKGKNQKYQVSVREPETERTIVEKSGLLPRSDKDN